ncbi:motility protein A [Actinomarinicola tropica]|uniref:Motility protein A n=1 Tax=Actinomarinicola tropica TaxID=2789776 RepID=A0A5Q2RLB8_9ACTN|nr:motility protein A [Actinomarinicola tropica]QGG94650.1 motility protein A [Actinomarinicola tropica]
MEPASLIGLVLVLVGTFIGSTLKGVGIGAYFGVPAAFLIVVVASIGATMMSNAMADVKNMPKAFMKAFKPGDTGDPSASIDTIVEFAERARREGLLALEDSIDKVEDPFMRRGLQMAIDGGDPEMVRDVMETEVNAMRERHKVGSQFMTSVGIFSPTFGIIGAVVGLIATLSKLDDPAHLGAGIAAAFIATFWGVFMANGIFLPIGKKLQRLSAEELAHKQLIIEGVLSIQAGSNPRMLDDILTSYLAPKARLARMEERQSA